jgi:hypothetical protein
LPFCPACPLPPLFPSFGGGFLTFSPAAGTVSGTALLLEHLALWQEPLRLKPPASYVVGTATLGTALTWWTLRQQCPQAAVAFWGIAGMGGAVVTTAYWLRHVVRQLDARAFQAGTVVAPRWTLSLTDEE